MKNNLTALFVIVFHSIFLHAQDPIYSLPDEPRMLIDNAVECLKKKQTNCNSFFEKAIKAAKATKSDSILAQTFFEICNVLDFVGKGDDHIVYAKRGLKLDGKNHPLVTNRLLRELGYAFSKSGKIDSLIPIYETAIYWAEYALSLIHI